MRAITFAADGVGFKATLKERPSAAGYGINHLMAAAALIQEVPGAFGLGRHPSDEQIAATARRYVAQRGGAE